MTSRRTLPVLLLAALALALPACRGGRAEVTSTTNTTTTGKALQDLEDARAKGIITEDEYKKERKRILSHT
jgi:uncharacterized membrane protein